MNVTKCMFRFSLPTRDHNLTQAAVAPALALAPEPFDYTKPPAGGWLWRRDLEDDPKMEVTEKQMDEHDKLMRNMPHLKHNPDFCVWPKTELQMMLLNDYLQTSCYDPLRPFKTVVQTYYTFNSLRAAAPENAGAALASILKGRNIGTMRDETELSAMYDAMKDYVDSNTPATPAQVTFRSQVGLRLTHACALQLSFIYRQCPTPSITGQVDEPET